LVNDESFVKIKLTPVINVTASSISDVIKALQMPKDNSYLESESRREIKVNFSSDLKQKQIWNFY